MICLIDAEHHALCKTRIGIGVVDVGLNAFLFELIELNETHAAVDAHREILARNHEKQRAFGVRRQVIGALIKPVAADIGDQQSALVDDLDKSRLASLRRCVTIAVGIARREHRERRAAYEILNERDHVVAHLYLRAPRGLAGLLSQRVYSVHMPIPNLIYRK